MQRTGGTERKMNEKIREKTADKNPQSKRAGKVYNFVPRYLTAQTDVGYRQKAKNVSEWT
jgi:hypothetical protein